MVIQHWDPEWGDRRQEIVFIGVGLDQSRLTRALDDCLVSATSFTPEEWAEMHDTFPSWGEPEREPA